MKQWSSMDFLLMSLVPLQEMGSPKYFVNVVTMLPKHKIPMQILKDLNATPVVFMLRKVSKVCEIMFTDALQETNCTQSSKETKDARLPRDWPAQYKSCQVKSSLLQESAKMKDVFAFVKGHWMFSNYNWNIQIEILTWIHTVLDKVRKKSLKFQEKNMKLTLHLLLFTIWNVL